MQGMVCLTMFHSPWSISEEMNGPDIQISTADFYNKAWKGKLLMLLRSFHEPGGSDYVRPRICSHHIGLMY